MNVFLTAYKTDGTKETGKIVCKKKDGEPFYAVFSNLSLQAGKIDATNGIVCRLDGLPKGRFVCDYLKSTCWCKPAFENDYSQVPDKTQVILVETQEGYFAVLPLIGKQYKTVLKGGEDGLYTLSYTGMDTLSECNEPLFAYGYGDDPYDLLKGLYAFGIETMGDTVCLRENRKFPEELEYLGWCSWDAFHIHVTADGIKRKAVEFQQKGVPVKWAMIDDMWADCPHLNEIPEDLEFWDMVKEMHRTKMRSFTADPDRFPNGLRQTVRDLKEFGIQTAVWFPTTGYWAGFEENCEFVQNNAQDFVKTQNGWTLIRPERESFDRIYGRFADYIQESGADFIKVDRQSLGLLYAGVTTIGEASYALQTAVENLANTRFNGSIINCMGMSAENMFHRERSAVVRCSDDFLPNDPEWFKRHIKDCGYNTLFWGNLYYTDWDMFWTNDQQALKNAVLHAVSGGPVYISDELGKTESELLKRLCNADGKILRAEQTLTPVKECLFVDAEREKTAMSLFNKKNGAVAIASFNLCDEKVSGEISFSQFGFDGGQVCVYDWFNGVAKICSASESLCVCLQDQKQIGLYIVSPVQGGFACVGDTEKFLSSYAVERKDARTVKAMGKTVALASEHDLNIVGASKIERKGNLYVCETEVGSVLTVETVESV